MGEPTEQEILDSQLRKEHERWQVLGLDPGAWKPSEGFLGLVLRLDIMTEFLVEAEIMDLEEANLRMQRKAIQRLAEIREAIAPQVAEARLNMIRNGIDPRNHQ
jgi:hypothetical protein